MTTHISAFATSYPFKRAIWLAIVAWCLPIVSVAYFVSQDGDPGDMNAMGWVLGFPYFFGFLLAAGGFASAIGAAPSAWSNPEYRGLKTLALWLNGLYVLPSILLFMSM